ncbi:mono/diheme cytochrome c family protein [Paraburkholderia terricola]|uniref:c-type cytochrome n=1 Tax=Paraburkholderia terricola TaxID=169427 RepID=UPI00285ED43D|nr:c-type cytochrome [Paraburkholderia terricola]MDR6449092.1 mono/diheme cytochrome c family protein [Paraburkholderia terricola]MDR6494001.1 mono/diheme cytochrome c family protein [Paraburkholderia terricola]
MKTSLHSFALASALLATGALAPQSALAGTASVRVCTFPGSPSTALDEAVAREAFRTAGIALSLAPGGFASSDDDGVSLKELDKALARKCDVIAGFPRSEVADGAAGKLTFSRGYLQSGYVSVTSRGSSAQAGDAEVVAATYASPAQLIAVQQPGVELDLENTAELTVDAVARGHARRAIVWYPAVVAYSIAHPERHFQIAGTHSPYADWHLTFAFGTNGAALRPRIDAALEKMTTDGRLAALTRVWRLPETALAAARPAATFAYRDGPARGNDVGRMMRAGGRESPQGRFIKVDASAPAEAPGFDRAQVAHGKTLYSSSCAKCHGPDLQGLNAPALRGPSFAPAANAKLTIGGVYGYMASNMPADRPGKMKPQDYADIMAFLLYSNGYGAGKTKLTDDAAKASTTPLNARAAQ